MSLALTAQIHDNHLEPGQLYGLAVDWTGADGGTSGSISAGKADEHGKAAWPAFPTLFVFVSHARGPGVLRLATTNAAGDELGGHHVLELQIA